MELDLNKVTLLIGEQATGKTTVAKLLSVCRYFSYIIGGYGYLNSFEEGLFSWGLHESINKDTSIFYDCEHYSLTVSVGLERRQGYDQDDNEVFDYDERTLESKLEPKSKEFINLLEELTKIKPAPFEIAKLDNNWTIPTSFFQNDVAQVLDNPFYLPVDRGLQSVFSLGKNSIQNISDTLYNQFAQLDQIAKRFGSETEIEPLDIVYKNENGRALIRKKRENDFFNLGNAANGYQSTIPVVLAIRYYNEIKKKKKTFIIEEPELNLFPSAQQKLIQFAVESVVNYGNTLLITTHSPYTLSSLNNLLYAYQIGKTYDSKAETIVKKKYWINPADVSAYMLKPDGTCEDIFDREEGLIKADKIDSVSEFLNEQFTSLLNIELGES